MKPPRHSAAAIARHPAPNILAFAHRKTGKIDHHAYAMACMNCCNGRIIFDSLPKDIKARLIRESAIFASGKPGKAKKESEENDS